jgi:hypothetical protein
MAAVLSKMLLVLPAVVFIGQIEKDSKSETSKWLPF